MSRLVVVYSSFEVVQCVLWPCEWFVIWWMELMWLMKLARLISD